MLNFIEIKRKIGEWIEQHKNINNASEAIDFYCDGQYVCISMQKADANSYIGATVTTNELVYRFLYKGNSKSHFEMAKLEHISTVKIENDD